MYSIGLIGINMFRGMASSGLGLLGMGMGELSLDRWGVLRLGTKNEVRFKTRRVGSVTGSFLKNARSSSVRSSF